MWDPVSSLFSHQRCLRPSFPPAWIQAWPQSLRSGAAEARQACRRPTETHTLIPDGGLVPSGTSRTASKYCGKWVTPEYSTPCPQPASSAHLQNPLPPPPVSLHHPCALSPKLETLKSSSTSSFLSLPTIHELDTHLPSTHRARSILATVDVAQVDEMPAALKADTLATGGQGHNYIQGTGVLGKRHSVM